jgi:hypothetical protein
VANQTPPIWNRHHVPRFISRRGTTNGDRGAEEAEDEIVYIKPAITTTVATLAVVVATAQASAQYYGAYGRGYRSAHPYWRGEPADRRPIWRYGYYQGNDPDNSIRNQLMRDPITPNK